MVQTRRAVLQTSEPAQSVSEEQQSPRPRPTRVRTQPYRETGLIDYTVYVLEAAFFQGAIVYTQKSINFYVFCLVEG